MGRAPDRPAAARAAMRRDRRDMTTAAIDIGTNTVRLLVARPATDGLDVLVREQEITRLGQGVDESRRLHPDAIARTVNAVARFAGMASDAGAEHVRVTGTSALRDGAN